MQMQRVLKIHAKTQQKDAGQQDRQVDEAANHGRDLDDGRIEGDAASFVLGNALKAG
jgi:hypothetical protein